MPLSFSTPLPPSPVAVSFGRIRYCPLEKLRLSSEEQRLLLEADENPTDYTLADSKEAYLYTRVLLKVLAEASVGLGSSKVSRVVGSLLESEATGMVASDPMGVVTHYAITKLYDVIVCLQEKKEGAEVSVESMFYHTETGQLIEDWRPLMRVLHLGGKGDIFAQRGAARCLAIIFLCGVESQQKGLKNLDSSSVEEPLSALVLWVLSELQSSAASSLALVTTTLAVLLTSPEARVIFQQNGGIGYLARHLRGRGVVRRPGESGASAQQIYELCFCLWTLTYDLNSSATIRSHFARDGAVPALVELVATAPREKVVRVALSALRNLATCHVDVGPQQGAKKEIDGSTFLAEMIGCNLMKSIDLMRGRQWTDPDIVDDVDGLYELLHENYKEMTRWDVYKVEVETGALEWGVVHTEAFFQEHARQIEGKDGDFALLKELIRLAASHDEEIAAIACFDIGEFARNYPGGRMVAKRLGAKEVAMQWLNSDNPELQRHSLQCVSKIMVQNWKSVQQVGH